MKKTYVIRGAVEYTIQATGKNGKMNIRFENGSVSGLGTVPARCTTANEEEQRVIENTEEYKKGKIKIESIEETKKPAEKVAGLEAEVTTLQQARQYLIEKGVSIEKLQNKADIKACAAEMNITFPNW